MFSPRMAAVSISAVAVALCIPAAAHAQVRSFNVAAQSASSGVREFAKQAGIQVIVAGSATEGRTTNAVKGEFNARTALGQLLSGSGLFVRSFDGKVAILDAADERADAETDSQIVVTGSRIARPELESSMPVSVVKMAEAESLGRLTIYDALQRSPAISRAASVGDAQWESWDAGLAAVDLRGMGTNRTLTLVDGRRRVSGSARSSAVDLNMIPAAMIEQVEIITGGAAAIYGADAVTGAVNIITRKDYEGLEVSATQGISQRGDAQKRQMSLVAGGQFADNRGSVSIGGTYTKNDPLYTQDREHTRTRLLFHPNPKNTGPHDGIADNQLYYDFKAMFIMPVPTYYLNGTTYILENGIPRAGSYNTRFYSDMYSNGDGGDGRNLIDNDLMLSPMESMSFISQLNYDLTDSISYRAQIDFGRTKYRGTKSYYREDARPTWLNGAGGAYAYLDNPYLPDAVRQVMLGNKLNRLSINRGYPEFGMIEDRHDRESYTLFNSLSGNVFDRFDWELFAQYGRTQDDVAGTNNVIASKWVAARDVIADPMSGEPVCRDPVARAAGCVPFNIFGTGVLTDEQRAYFLHTRREQRTNTQTVMGGTLSGTPFSLPYGEVSLVLGAEYRKETLKTIDDVLGLNGEVSHTGNNAGKHPEIESSFDVSEFFGELVIPLLRNMPFVEKLQVEGAYRYSDYSTVGTTHAWKAGLTWSPFQGLTLRGVRSRSVRTPNFGELYQSQTITATDIYDPCEDNKYFQNPTRTANCQALGIDKPIVGTLYPGWVTSGGNPDLQPEISNSFTVGLVAQPDFLPGFSFTADYWDIKIDDVITSFTPHKIAELCVDLESLDNKFCDLVTRGADHAITAVNTTQINAAKMVARGIDAGIQYRTDLGAGQLHLGFSGTYLLAKETLSVADQSNSVVKSAGGWTSPRFRGTLFANYDLGRVSVGLDTRFTGAAKFDVNATSDEQYSDNSVPGRLYNDLSVQYRISDEFSVSLIMNNLFDTKPPYMPTMFLGLGYYDIVGRSFAVSAKAKF